MAEAVGTENLSRESILTKFKDYFRSRYIGVAIKNRIIGDGEHRDIFVSELEGVCSFMVSGFGFSDEELASTMDEVADELIDTYESEDESDG